MSKTLQYLLTEHGTKYPLAMNAALKNFAKVQGQGLSLLVERNFPYFKEEEDMVQGVEVTKDLEITLHFLGVTMTPSVTELEHLLRTKNGFEPLETVVTFRNQTNTYKGTTFEAILNQTLSLWIDFNALIKL